MIRFVPMTAEHIPFMQAIEADSFPTAWPGDSFQRELTDNKVAHYLVALEDEEVAGYVGAWIILDEVHITIIAVDPKRRARGLGRRILARLLLDAVERGARCTVLEVRESNAAAIKMYRHFGFREIGRRKRYYENEEDALVLWVGQMQQHDFRTLLETTLS